MKGPSAVKTEASAQIPLPALREKIEIALVAACQRFYHSRLWSLVIYGSTARGTFSLYSDVDFLIVADPLPRGRLARVREFEAIEHEVTPLLRQIRAEGWNVAVSPIFKTREETQFGSPLFLDMVEDARILFDRDQFFANRLAQLRDRLKALGSRRIWKGQEWYWDLKPDWKPGDVIEL